jgi:hypothetical protein
MSTLQIETYRLGLAKLGGFSAKVALPSDRNIKVRASITCVDLMTTRIYDYAL